MVLLREVILNKKSVLIMLNLNFIINVKSDIFSHNLKFSHYNLKLE